MLTLTLSLFIQPNACVFVKQRSPPILRTMYAYFSLFRLRIHSQGEFGLDDLKMVTVTVTVTVVVTVMVTVTVTVTVAVTAQDTKCLFIQATTRLRLPSSNALFSVQFGYNGGNFYQMEPLTRYAHTTQGSKKHQCVKMNKFEKECLGSWAK
jgi:hypothetical protein